MIPRGGSRVGFCSEGWSGLAPVDSEAMLGELERRFDRVGILYRVVEGGGGVPFVLVSYYDLRSATRILEGVRELGL